MCFVFFFQQRTAYDRRISAWSSDVCSSDLTVSDVGSKERKRRPAAPFTTSPLQQEAARKLGFTTSRTMKVAQGLYEGVALGDEGNVGLITYMRTDSSEARRVREECARTSRSRSSPNH